MSNMSYCMFSNTLADFIDCAERLEKINLYQDIVRAVEEKEEE